jgi:translocation and assembly module TamB
MSRRIRILRNIAVGTVASIAVVTCAVLIAVRTDWFRKQIREKVAAAIADGTGGVTEIGSFTFDASKLHAHITNLVIHGSEPAGSAPLVRVESIDLYGRFLSGGHIAGISDLKIERPQVNVLVFPDGRTNLPTPKPSAPSKDTPLETVVDLAVGHFELRGGVLSYNSRPQALDVRANNLHAQLWYHTLRRDYQGQLSLEPIYVAAGRNTPVTINLTMPVALGRDGIHLRGVRIATAHSAVQIDGSLEDLRQPKLAAHIRGKVALTDLKNAADLPIEPGPGLPSTVDLDADAEGSVAGIRVSSLHLALGHSNLDAGGVLKDPRGAAALHYRADLALGELALLARVNARIAGNVAFEGEAALDANNRYQVSGHVAAPNLAFSQGSLRIRRADLSTDVRLTPDRLDLNRLRLAALGGELVADASLENFARYSVTGNLRHLDTRQALLSVDERLPYDGSISGTLEANGDLRAPGMRALEAGAALTIAPGRNGIPVRGRVRAGYSGARDDLAVEDSYLVLPHTRLTLAGSLRHRLDISVTTSDLRDLPTAQSPVTLTGGQAGFVGNVTGGIAAPRIAGHLSATHFQVEDRAFDSLNADLSASASGATVKNGLLARGAMQSSFSANTGLREWKPRPSDPVSADVTVQGGDLADIMALAGQRSRGFSGTLSAGLHAQGTIGNPSGNAAIHVEKGTLGGEPFDRMDAQVNLSDQLATIPSATLIAGNGRADFTAEFRHARDSFATGQIRARLHTNQIDLAQIRALEQQAPAAMGRIELTAEASGDLNNSEFLLTSINAGGSVRGLRYQGQFYGDLQLQVRTSGQTATLGVTSDFAGSSIRLQAATQLVPGYPTSAEARVNGLAVERVLALTHRTDIPAKGKLALNARVRGTLRNPEGDATIDLTDAAVYGESIDGLHANVAYLARRIDLAQFELSAGPSRIALSGTFDHPEGNLECGNVQFRVENSSVDLARVRNVQQRHPGLGGSVRLSADGSLSLGAESPRMLLAGLNASLTTSNLSENGTSLGNLDLAAHTASGNRLDFKLASNIAGSTVQASGNGQLGGDYPLTAELSFGGVQWTRLAPLLGATSAGTPPAFDATADGKISVNGPVLRVDQLHGAMELTRLAIQTLPQPGGGKPITIQNQGPVSASLDRGTLRLDNFHFAGPQTDIQASGTAGVSSQTLDLAVNAGIDLGMLRNFSREFVSSGSIKLASAVRGTISNPEADGRLELQNATLNNAQFPNGLSNANGVVLLRGSRATIQNLTAESGGGKIGLKGFASLAGNHEFALSADASRVRVRVQEGVRVMMTGDLHLAGNTGNSTASGALTLEQFDYAPHSDVGSMLQRAVPAVQNRATPSPLLDNMKLDLRVRTSPATRVQTSLAESLQIDADLRVRGSPSQPAVLGRINLTHGRLIFFGSTYAINAGSISFFNPLRIDPVLNLSLETQSKGVDVTLNVTGPVDNMKLTYTSNPPLQFQEIVSLLSAGTTPTSDPTLLANQPTPPQQTLQQRGESAILGEAVANPVANRLQRVFGVSQLKIDPAFTGSSQLPTAQVTLQQQVSNGLTLTYVSALDNPNSTLVRAEWALNRQWSATAVRDQNGIFSINLLYKKQFR